MADHQEAESIELPHSLQQVQQLSLERHVEPGCRLVDHDQAGSSTSTRAMLTRRACPPLT